MGASAADLDAAIAGLIEGTVYPGSYRQQSDTRQNREQVDLVNVAYQLRVWQRTTNPQRGANQDRRVYVAQVTIKKHVADEAAERVWWLGGMADGLDQMLAWDFWRTQLGQLAVVEAGTAPQTVEDPETVGRVIRYTIETELEIRA